MTRIKDFITLSKKHIALGLAVTLTLGVLLPVTAVNAQENEYQSDSVMLEDSIELTEEEADLLIAELENFLRIENGHFVFDAVPFVLYAQFGYEVVQGMIDGVEVINELVDTGDAIINDDLSIDGVNSSRLRSNVTDASVHWWGVRFRFNRTRTNTVIVDFRQSATNNTLAATVAGILTKSIGGVGALPFAFNSWQFNSKANALQNRLNETTNRGTELDLHHGITWVTRAQ